MFLAGKEKNGEGEDIFFAEEKKKGRNDMLKCRKYMAWMGKKKQGLVGIRGDVTIAGRQTNEQG